MKFYHPSISIIKKYLLNFYQNKQAVYVPMMALLSFVVIGYIAFVVDGTGLILDKVRLTQGIEQAGLLVVAEDNDFRANKIHYSLTHGGTTEPNEEAIKKRNYEMITGMARSYYLGNEYKTSKDKQNNFNITDNYSYLCQQKADKSQVYCTVNGDFDRFSWLYFGEKYRNNFGTFHQVEKVAANTSYVVKKIGGELPEMPHMDIVFVSDVSGSMNYRIDGRKKIDLLKEVLNEISHEVLDGENFNNRMRFIAFAGGAQQLGDRTHCSLPYIINDKNNPENSSNNKFYKVRQYVGCGNYPKEGYRFNFRATDGAINTKDYIQQHLGLVEHISLSKYTDPFIMNRACSNNSGGCLFREFNIWVDLKNVIQDGKSVFDNETHHLKNISKDLNNDNVIDYKKTIELIKNFDGNNISSDKIITFHKSNYCLLNNQEYSDLVAPDLKQVIPYTKYITAQFKPFSCNSFKELPKDKNIKLNDKTYEYNFVDTTSRWYNHGEAKNLTNEFSIIKPAGSTIASSGLIIGTNLLINETPSNKNTLRKLVILSDGVDELLSDTKLDITPDLINHGMCEAIRERLDTYPEKAKYPSDIYFIAFGYENKFSNKAEKFKRAWIQCVGEKNYMEADNKQELLEKFKLAINSKPEDFVEEEVGRAVDSEPTN